MNSVNEIKRRNTKQKQIIVEFLKNNKNKHLTADQILDNLKDKNLKVSKATIYRLLNSLSEEGTLRKYLLSESLSSCYQYVEDLQGCNKHYHLVCDICGKVEHFDDEYINKIENNVFNKNKFEIDLQRVIFYGKCKSCK